MMGVVNGNLSILMDKAGALIEKAGITVTYDPTTVNQTNDTNDSNNTFFKAFIGTASNLLNTFSGLANVIVIAQATADLLGTLIGMAFIDFVSPFIPGNMYWQGVQVKLVVSLMMKLIYAVIYLLSLLEIITGRPII